MSIKRRSDLLVLIAVAVVLVGLGIGVVIFNGPQVLGGRDSINKTNQAVLTQIAQNPTSENTPTPSDTEPSDAGHGTLSATDYFPPTPSQTMPSLTPTLGAQERLETAASRRLIEQLTLTGTAIYEATINGLAAQYLTQTEAAAPTVPTFTPIVVSGTPPATMTTSFSPTPLLETLVSQRLSEVQTQTAAAAYQATAEGIVNQMLTSTANARPSATPTPTPQVATLVSQYQSTSVNMTATAVIASTIN